MPQHVHMTECEQFVRADYSLARWLRHRRQREAARLVMAQGVFVDLDGHLVALLSARRSWQMMVGRTVQWVDRGVEPQLSKKPLRPRTCSGSDQDIDVTPGAKCGLRVDVVGENRAFQYDVLNPGDVERGDDLEQRRCLNAARVTVADGHRIQLS
jgi:hypothetical protein